MSLSSASDANPLYAALRDGFPTDLDQIAAETIGADAHAYTWRDLDHGSAMMANLWQSLDVPRGARIAVQVDKSIEAVMLHLATLRSGLVYVSLPVASDAAQLETLIADTAPAVLVCTGPAFGTDSKIAFRAGTAYVFTLNDDRTGSLLQRALRHSREHAPVAVAIDDPAAILYRNDRSGRLVAMRWTHATLLAQLRLGSNFALPSPSSGLRSTDILLHVLPIDDTGGLFAALYGALINGCTMRWFGAFDATAVIATLPRATVLIGTAAHFEALSRNPHLTKEACVSMRFFLSASGPLPQRTAREFEHHTGHVVGELPRQAVDLDRIESRARPVDRRGW